MIWGSVEQLKRVPAYVCRAFHDRKPRDDVKQSPRGPQNVDAKTNSSALHRRNLKAQLQVDAYIQNYDGLDDFNRQVQPGKTATVLLIVCEYRFFVNGPLILFGRCGTIYARRARSRLMVS